MIRRREFIVVGCGPAGISAAIQARRDGMNVLLIGDEPPGGLSAAARKIANLPVLPWPMSGKEFGHLLRRRLETSPIERIEDSVVDVRKESDGFAVTTANSGTIGCDTLLLSCGTKPVPFSPGFPARPEAKPFLHRDIRPLPDALQGKRIAVIGGGEAAADSALWIHDRGGKAIIYVRGDEMHLSPALAAELKRSGITICFGIEIEALDLRGNVLSAETKGRGSFGRLEFDYLLVCIGRRPRLELYWRLGGTGHPATVTTKIPGLFLAGDMLRRRNRFIAPAVGDGAKAAFEAGRFLARSIPHEEIPGHEMGRG